jgi:hypothetical protein
VRFDFVWLLLGPLTQLAFREELHPMRQTALVQLDDTSCVKTRNILLRHIPQREHQTTRTSIVSNF